MVDSPSGRVPAKAPRWDLADTEGYGGGNCVSWFPWMFSRYVGIYRRKKYVGGCPRGPRDRGPCPPCRARPPVSWAPRAATDVLLPPIYAYVPRKHPGAPRNTISTTVTFCIHEISSWSLRRLSAGGGIGHGGLLHQHPCPSDEL